MKDQPPIFLTDINIHSDTQAEPRKLSSVTLYIDLWQERKPAPGKNPPVISPPVLIFRRIGIRAEIRTQNPVLSNTRLAKIVPLSHLRRPKERQAQGLSMYRVSLPGSVGLGGTSRKRRGLNLLSGGVDKYRRLYHRNFSDSPG
jgi:hypothetical protein